MQTITQRLANPTQFMELSGALLPWLAGAAAASSLYGLYLSFFVAPPDYQQGETVRIMFIHVPSAWLSMAGYMLIAISAFGLLVFRHPLADVSAKAAAPLGAAFTFLALVTGSLWGRPTWGTYWVWDARLTSVLILFFLYLGLIALRSSIEDESLAAKLTAILALVGIVMLPIIKFSVDFGNTLHQPASVMRLGGPTIDASLLHAAARHGGGLHAAVRGAARQSDAQRDPATARQGAADGRGRARAVGPAGGGGVADSWIWDRTQPSSGPPTAHHVWWSRGSSRGWSSTAASRSAAWTSFAARGVKRRFEPAQQCLAMKSE